jgi:hypothetical protein
VPRRQLHARGRQKVDERVGRGRHGDVHGVEHLLVLLRPVTARTLGCAPVM